MGQLIDEKFHIAYNLTYNTMAMHKDVDTSMLRRAIWNYIHCMFGIRSVFFLTLIKTFPSHEVLGCLHAHMRAHITDSIVPVYHRTTAWVLGQVRQVRS